MPRKQQRTLSGAPASPPRMPVNTTYGEGERALESQRRTPVPDVASRGTGGPAPPAGGTEGGAAGGQNGTADRFAQILAAAQGMAPPEGTLSAPSQRPLEPLQAGMGSGAGAIPAGTEFSDALFDLRAMAAQYPEYRGLLRMIALAEEQR